jgi:branched-chain amino acid transport system substrate-binding protein
VIIANAVDAAMISQQVRKFDRKTALDLAEWAATERLLELGGTAVEGASVDQFFDRGDNSPRYISFLKSYRERFGLEPGFAGVAAYDAANVSLTALAGNNAGRPLKDVILSTRSYQKNIHFNHKKRQIRDRGLTHENQSPAPHSVI